MKQVAPSHGSTRCVGKARSFISAPTPLSLLNTSRVVGSTRNPSVEGRCSLHSQMSVCRVLGKLSNMFTIEVVFVNMEEDTYCKN